MLTLEQIRTQLEDRNLPVVAKRTGVSYRTIVNIKNGTNANPSLRVIKALSTYFGA